MGPHQLAAFVGGCSFMGVYHAGAAHAVRSAGLGWGRLGGASSGSLVAAALACGCDARDLRDAFLRAASQARAHRLLGPIGRLGQIVGSAMEDLLPADAHLRCSGGRLNVSVCRAEGPLWYTGLRNLRLDAWDSRADLIEALKVSCHIPLVSGPEPLFRGSAGWIDGGTLRLGNLPDPARDPPDVTISHWPDTDCTQATRGCICPRKGRGFSSWWETVFPPEQTRLLELFREGQLDAERWLRAQEADGREGLAGRRTTAHT